MAPMIPVVTTRDCRSLPSVARRSGHGRRFVFVNFLLARRRRKRWGDTAGEGGRSEPNNFGGESLPAAAGEAAVDVVSTWCFSSLFF